MNVLAIINFYIYLLRTFGGIIFVSLALSALTKAEYTKDKCIPLSKSKQFYRQDNFE